MTSSISPPRRVLAPCSPITQARASTTFDLPAPFGPTMQVIPGSSCSEVADANDLKPRRVRLLTYTCDGLLWRGDERHHCTGEERVQQGLRATELGSVLCSGSQWTACRTFPTSACLASRSRSLSCCRCSIRVSRSRTRDLSRALSRTRRSSRYTR